MLTASFFSYDGPGRISIARGQPRGQTGFKVYSALAPGRWFNSVPPAEYATRYFGEILGRLDPVRVHDELWALAGGVRPVLLCWERPPIVPAGRWWERPDEPIPRSSNWCHRAMTAAWLSDAGFSVEEYQPPKAGPGPATQESLL